MPDATFVSVSRFQPEHPRALALYCSDGRFTGPVEELLESLGHDRLNTVTLPGGPALLDLWSASYADRDAVARALSFLIEGHALTHLVLVAHEGCGYYRARHALLAPAEVEKRQVQDLRTAAAAIRTANSRTPLDVALFYARAADGAVRFEPVPVG